MYSPAKVFNCLAVALVVFNYASVVADNSRERGVELHYTKVVKSRGPTVESVIEGLVKVAEYDADDDVLEKFLAYFWVCQMLPSYPDSPDRKYYRKRLKEVANEVIEGGDQRKATVVKLMLQELEELEEKQSAPVDIESLREEQECRKE